MSVVPAATVVVPKAPPVASLAVSSNASSKPASRKVPAVSAVATDTEELRAEFVV